MGSKLKFIGTSSGQVSLKRFHTSLYITDGSFNTLVDAGDGISKALLTAGIDFNSIDAVLISHFHSDHAAGLGSLLVQMKLGGRTKPLSIYTTEDLVQTVKFFLYNQYIFMPNYDFNVKFCRYEYDVKVKLSDKISFIPRLNSHLDKFEEYAGMGMISFESSSFMFFVGDKNIFYTGDIGSSKDLFLFDDYHIDIMISECRHPSPDEIKSAFEKLKAEKLYFTHIADEDEAKLAGYVVPSRIYISSDGTEISL